VLFVGFSKLRRRRPQKPLAERRFRDPDQNLTVAAAGDIGVADRMACRCLVPLLVDGISRGKNAFVYCARLSDKLDPLEFSLRNKSNNLTHISLQTRLGNDLVWYDDRPSIGRWGLDLDC
jgi:hypothetical protein